MTEFSHSNVLFYGDDGLPLQFNIQNAVEKEALKAIIEFGGGICTFSDDAIHVVSPGTKVVNVFSTKELVSSRYIFDCVREDELLDIDDYKIEINEMPASDFSDTLQENPTTSENRRKLGDDSMDTSVDIIQPDESPSPNLINPSNSNHAFDFVDSEVRDNTVCNVFYNNSRMDINAAIVPVQTSELLSHIQFGANVPEKTRSAVHVDEVPSSLEDHEPPINAEHNITNEISYVRPNNPVSNDVNIDEAAAVVSSSQGNEDRLDPFDNMVLNKAQAKNVELDDSLSQSYTVSSSADAQVSPKQQSHHTSAELFDGSSAAPDSASQTTERQRYIKSLEKEIEQILKKPSPKSIQDKIVLVKYISIVKKLAPAIVLQTLQKF